MLTFNLKKEWFEKIKSGEKTHEYREANIYWQKRLWTKIYIGHTICFACGYPKKDDKEKRLYAKVKDFKMYFSGIKTDLKIDKPVFDIEFELIREVKND